MTTTQHDPATDAPRADLPAAGELGHMARLTDLVDSFARDWKAALAAVPGGKMRNRVRPWAEAYRADTLGLRGQDDPEDS